MQAKIGQLTLVNDFFGKSAHQSGPAERKKMIDRTHDLPVVRQCQILRIVRSTAYYTLEPTSPADLALMRRIDELHLDYPSAGSRMLRDMLKQEGQPPRCHGLSKPLKYAARTSLSPVR